MTNEKTYHYELCAGERALQGLSLYPEDKDARARPVSVIQQNNNRGAFAKRATI
jgi:hypothetical protein